MTLAIESALRPRRKYLQDKQSHAKARLLNAYISKDQRRIRQAKITLARILLELAGNPELGIPRKFRWGSLEIVYAGGFDETISWTDCLETRSDYFRVARLLERSVFDAIAE